MVSITKGVSVNTEATETPLSAKESANPPNTMSEDIIAARTPQRAWLTSLIL
jgi:hypothetical protein